MEAKKPTVTLVNHGFYNDAVSAASTKGIPVLRIVPENVPCESSVKSDIEAGMNEAMETIIDGLLRPLTPEEAAPQPK